MNRAGSSKRYSLALSLACLVSVACDDSTTPPPHEGSTCDRADSGTSHDDCHDDSLWCGPDAICVARPGLDEVCDPAPCSGELYCHLDKRCGVSRLAGEACSSSIECASGLNCNQGELPELFAVGLCRGPAAEGEPCGFGHASDDVRGEALAPDFNGIDRGDCVTGLSCAPLFPGPGSGDAPPMCIETKKGVACFFAGACMPDGTLPFGAPCGRSEACASGVCAVFEPPLSAAPQPGFGQGGDWLGPRVGQCIGAADAISRCGRGDPCARGFACLDRQCVAPHTQRPNEKCTDDTGLECAFGLVCKSNECLYPEAVVP